MRVENVVGSKHKKELNEIYAASFSKEKRIPFALMTTMSLLWHTQFLAFYDEETLCGFVYMTTLGKQTVILFLAVDESLRSRGYGSSILREVEAMYPKNKIIISIEPCEKNAKNIEQRLKRKAFYLRNGYGETGFWMKLAGELQEILIKNGTFHKTKFITALALYSFCTAIPKVWKNE